MGNLKYGRKRQLLREQYDKGVTLKDALKNLKEAGVKVNRSYGYKRYGEFKNEPKDTLKLGLDPQEFKTKKTEKEIKIKEEPIEVPKELESASESSELKDKLKKLEEGTLTKEDLKALFAMINEYYPEKYRPSERSEGLLAALWLKPLNKHIENIEDDNIPIYAAALITALVYIPKTGQVIKEYLDKKEKEKEKEKTKTDKS